MIDDLETIKVRADRAVLFAEISASPMNLLGRALVRDLVTLIQQAEADDGIRVLVFTSADTGYFISHADVTRVAEYRDQAVRKFEDTDAYRKGGQTVAIADLPVDRSFDRFRDKTYAIG
jgi:enoyl-CoA hydratase/carnithine racemase